MQFSFGKPESCPTSTLRHKEHLGVTQSRKTKYATYTVKGKKVTSKSPTYVDSLKCKFCGATHEQEWMNAPFVGI